MKQLVQFVSENRFTAEEKMRLYRKFEKVVVKRNSSLIDKKLYTFLYVYAGYIAHYNQHGFIEEYSGLHGMVEFLKGLLHHHFEWGAGTYQDLGNAMKELAQQELPKVLAEWEMKKENQEKDLPSHLAAKHGLALKPLMDTEMKHSVVVVTDDPKATRRQWVEGQLLFEL